MWWAGSERLGAYLAPDALALLGGEPLSAPAWHVGPDAGLVTLDTHLMGRQSKARLSIHLGGDHVRPLLMPPLPEGAPAKDLVIAAHGQLGREYGTEVSHELWMERPRAGRSTFAVAVPAAVLDSLYRCEAVKAKKVRIDRVQPWWAASLGQALELATGTGWLAAMDGQSLWIFDWAVEKNQAHMAGLERYPATTPEAALFLLKRRAARQPGSAAGGRLAHLGAGSAVAGAGLEALIHWTAV